MTATPVFFRKFTNKFTIRCITFLFTQSIMIGTLYMANYSVVRQYGKYLTTLTVRFLLRVIMWQFHPLKNVPGC